MDRLCSVCGGARFIRPRDEAGPYVTLPCPGCTLAADPPDLTDEIEPDMSDPLDLDWNELPTPALPPPPPTNAPTPLRPVFVPPEARPTPAAVDYEEMLRRVPRVEPVIRRRT